MHGVWIHLGCLLLFYFFRRFRRRRDVTWIDCGAITLSDRIFSTGKARYRRHLGSGRTGFAIMLYYRLIYDICFRLLKKIELFGWICELS